MSDCIIVKKKELSPENYEIFREFFEIGSRKPLVIKPISIVPKIVKAARVLLNRERYR